MTPARVNRVQFENALKDTTRLGRKVPTSSYLPDGAIPVIDQSKPFISGFVNDQALKYQGKLPVLIFGDHTRVVKYVDFDFAMGADGVKVLTPTNEFSAQYLYYFLKSNPIDEAGYSRHFKYLKQLSFPLIPIEEQLEVVDKLSQADRVQDLIRSALEKIDALISSLFCHMFGDPVANSKNWPVLKFSDIGTLDRGKSRHRPRDAVELYGGKYPFIQTGDIANSGGEIHEFESTYSELGLAQSKLWEVDTLCITIAANIAKTAILKIQACFPDSVVGFLPNLNQTNNCYIQSWLKFLQPILEANAPQAAQKNINLQILRDLPIPIPPIELQNDFASRIEEIGLIRKRQERALIMAQEVFSSLSNKYFGLS